MEYQNNVKFFNAQFEDPVMVDVKDNIVNELKLYSEDPVTVLSFIYPTMLTQDNYLGMFANLVAASPVEDLSLDFMTQRIAMKTMFRALMFNFDFQVDYTIK